MRLTEKYLREKDNPYIKINKIFYEVEKYKKNLKSWDREMYAFCRDRISLSLSEGWINKKGEIYFKANQDTLGKYLGISRKTVNEGLKKLINLNLLEVEKGLGKGNENVYYLCEIPEFTGEVLNVTESYSECNPELQSNLNVTESYTNKTNIMYLYILNKTYSNKDIEEINGMVIEREFSEDIKKDIAGFIKDRGDRRSKMTLAAIKIFLNKLSKIDDNEYKRECINEAIEKGWKTIFPKEKGAINENNQFKGNEKKSEKPDYSEGW